MGSLLLQLQWDLLISNMMVNRFPVLITNVETYSNIRISPLIKKSFLSLHISVANFW